MGVLLMQGKHIKKWLTQESTFEACIITNNSKNVRDKNRYGINDRQNNIWRVRA